MSAMKNEVLQKLYDRVNTTNWCRLGRAFKTKYSNFFYDSGTGKIFEVNDSVYAVLNTLTRSNSGETLLGNEDIDLFKAVDEILLSIEEEHLLPSRPITALTGPQVTALEDNLNNSVRSVTLEVTEECNLRCKYCIYGNTHQAYRTHGSNKMTAEVAQRAVDFLISHSSEQEDLNIGFYGGEPLMNWSIVEQTIKYANSLKISRDISYAMTSNLTLMTPEIAEFIANTKNFNVLFSLDGPKHINDKSRVYPNGRGAFDDAIRGYNYLLTAFRNKKDKDNKSIIMFNAVIPFAENQELDEINAFFKTLDPDEIGGTMNVMASRVSKTSKSTEYIAPYERSENRLDTTINPDPLVVWGQDKVNDRGNVTRGYMESFFASIHNRPLSDLPFENAPMNGCCVPGGRKLYVKANGDFIPCERLGDVKPIGNVFNGFDISEIKKTYVDDFMHEAVKFCKDCWAVHLCKNCYADCFDLNGKMDFSHRHASCRNCLMNLENDLISYHEVLVENPAYIESLNELVIT